MQKRTLARAHLAVALLATVGFGAGPVPNLAAAGATEAHAADYGEGSGVAVEAEATPDQAVKQRPSAVNSFNRLLRSPAAALNAPPSEDGIHDPENSGTHLLQWPAEAFEDLPKSNDGNRVDWVKALNQGLIEPMVDLRNPDAKPFIMDLVIVREVKGSMPDVVYPHQQHTEWLDCTNCHDEIFVPEKGKNQISMAAILLGQKCGVCHGKVAFPVSDCRRCHAKPKSAEQLKALANESAWRSGQENQSAR